MGLSCARRAPLLLLCFFIVGAFFYVNHGAWSSDSQQPAGAANQLDWRLSSAPPEEEEEEEEEVTEAACSLRNTVRNDFLLRSQFRFSTPVLQSARSLSGTTWEGLKSRAPPYGWRGLPVHVVESTLSLLNSSRLIGRRPPGGCVRCAVVGNGGILRGSGQGRSIDDHDLVFRMNGAVIDGFEEDVGTKISFYGFTTNTMKNALQLYGRYGFTETPRSPEIKYIFIPSDLRDYVMMAAAVQGRTVASGRDQGDRPSTYFGHKPPESFKILHPGFISYVTDSFLPSPLLTDVRTRHLYMPSTGALMLLTALHTCDQVSAFGFITENYADFSDHYYDSQPLKFFANHDLLLEARLWETLHRRRVLRLYHRTHRKSQLLF